MNLPEALNPVAYIREVRLLVAELRGGVTADQLFNLVLTSFVFAMAALVQIPAWILRTESQSLEYLAVLALPALVVFAFVCLWQVSRSRRDDGD